MRCCEYFFFSELGVRQRSENIKCALTAAIVWGCLYNRVPNANGRIGESDELFCCPAMYTVFQKVVHQAHIDNLVNSQRIFIIPSLAHSLENLR